MMIALVFVCVFSSLAALFIAYRQDRARVARFAREATEGVASQREAVFALGRRIFSGVERSRKNPVFISRFLKPLGSAPASILGGGACCNGLHRLFIAALDTLGIRAAQVTVLRGADPANCHCLAQVTLAGERLLIDVDYGIWFCQSDGSSVDVVGLRRGIRPLFEPFVAGDVAKYQGSGKTRPAGYPDCEYYRFDYELTRTANWTMSPLRRVVYSVLSRLTDGQIDLLFLPPILEWPEVLLGIAVCGVALLFALGWVAFKGF